MKVLVICSNRSCHIWYMYKSLKKYYYSSGHKPVYVFLRVGVGPTGGWKPRAISESNLIVERFVIGQY